MDYRVLLYYKYVHLDDPQGYRDEHFALCEQLGLRGRIIVAEEGINGTVSGTFDATQAYIDAMHADPRTADLWFKIDLTLDVGHRLCNIFNCLHSWIFR